MRDFQIEPVKVPLVINLYSEISKVFKGDPKKWEPLLLGLFGHLHVLVEDLPGVGKTTLAKAFSRALGLDFGRIQFTPDLLPGDILGMTVWSQEKKDFYFRPGGIMHQFVLADEINRSSSRTQSALLEAMQEGHITVDGVTYDLPQPFMVVATQNPQNFQGTFPLPEAQIDRFGLVFNLGYPQGQDALEILDLALADPGNLQVNPLGTSEGILRARETIKTIVCKDSLKSWVIKLVERSRKDSRIALGLSPRASLHWIQASRASAYLRGRDFVIPEDLMHTALWALPHRLILSVQARLDGKNAYQVVENLIDTQDIPLK